MRFNGKEYKLNSMLEVVYENEEGHISIKMGRLFDYNSKKIFLDCSAEFVELDIVVEISKNKIKKIRKVDWTLWR